MIKSKVITITEVDEPEEAVAEFNAGLADFELLKNTVGIVSVNAEFIESGAYQAVAKASPFPLAGMTTASQSSNGEIGIYLFSVMVLTSDDCRFVCGLSGEFPEVDPPAPIIRESYLSLKEQLGEKPKLVFSYAPFTEHCSGDIVEVIPETDPEVIIFGAVASGTPSDISLAKYNTLCGETVSAKSAAFILVSGEVNPEVFVCSLTKEAVVMPNIGIITKARRNRIIEIDGMAATDFFDKIGFGVGDLVSRGIFSSTFALDLKEKGTISRSPLSVDGTEVICAARVYEGAMISVAFSTSEVVIKTAEDLTDKVSACGGERTAIIYSCAGRQTGLLPELMKELEVIGSRIPKRITHTACYGHGEVCPASVTPEKVHNHEHNETVIACVI